MALPPTKISDEVQKQVYEDLLKGPMRKFGDALSVIAERVLTGHLKCREELALDYRVGLEAADHRRWLASEAIRKIPPERLVFPAPQIAGPIFRESEFEPEGTPIWRMWKELLARACDSAHLNEAHPAFPNIIGQLAVSEVVILNAYLTENLPVIRIPAGLDPSTGRTGFKWRLSIPSSQEVDQSQLLMLVEHIAQLGLIRESELGRPLTIREGNSDVHIESKSIVYRLTAFGSLFLKAVTEPNSGTP